MDNNKKNRILTLFGSGETSPHMAKNYRKIIDDLDFIPKKNILLDTPFGFQENNDVLSEKIQDYFSKKINLNLKNLNFKNEESFHDNFNDIISEADFIFSGPGSPTYASEIWLKHNFDKLLKNKLNNGVVMAFASAAALTLGSYVIPVYEIYKVGENKKLCKGLDILDFLGKETVIVPHFNNQEGGDHDTSYCFIGKKRFQNLIKELDVITIGIDEHTSLTFDLESSLLDVKGLGNVYFESNEGAFCLKNGERMNIEKINSNYTPKTVSTKKNKIVKEDSAKEDSISLNISDLINIRKIARSSKMYEISDNIRDLLISKGIEIEDKNNNTVWKKLD